MADTRTLVRTFLLSRGRGGVLRDVALFLLRLGFGLTMALSHGRSTLVGFLEDPSRYPDPLGLGPQLSMGLMAFSELACALAVAAGLLTRLALVPLVLGMGTAFFVYHAGDPFGARELALLYLTVWVVLLVAGPGRLSCDHLLLGRSSRRKGAALPAVLVAIAPWAASAVRGQGADPTLEAFHRGEASVRRALAAMGGMETLRAAGGITLAGRGRMNLSARMQGTNPERPDFVALTEALAVDLGGDRVAYETHGRVNPDADEWNRYLYDDRGRMLVVLRLDRKAFWVPGNDDQKRRYARMVPQILLRDALDRRRTLRHLGELEGREAVASVLPGGEPMTLLFDSQGGLLRGFEYLLDVPLLGDTAVRWRFEEYRAVEGLGLYPAGYRIELGDRLLKQVRYESIRAGAGDGALFREPDGIAFPQPPPPPEAEEPGARPQDTTLPEVRTLAPGVHLALRVRDGFHVLFVELEDYVLVVDTPAGYHELQMVPAVDWAGAVTSSSVGRRLLETVRATVPDKPIRYVVSTHHHGDHTGGIRPFLAAGATVIASETTRTVIELAARAEFRLEPDELTGREVVPEIEVVDGEKVLSDGRRTLRIIDVGPNPHVEGMLVVYLPEEGILYQADLFMPAPAPGFPDPARVPIMRWFVRWLDRAGIDPEAIYAIHGSAKVTAEQLETIRRALR